MATNDGFEVIEGDGESVSDRQSPEIVLDGETLIGCLIPADDGGYLVLAPIGGALDRGEGRARLVALRQGFLDQLPDG